MSRYLTFHHGGVALSVQDAGRAGFIEFGLSKGGAADALALAEGAALLGQSPFMAALEMAGTGGVFSASAPLRIALTGAPMRASLDGRILRWNAVHRLEAGQKLHIGAAQKGIYGYLHVGGGLATPEVLGSRSAHLVAGLGGYLAPNTRLPVGPDPALSAPGQHLPAPRPRFEGGEVRMVASAQTARFEAATRARFEATPFIRSPQGNRQGVRLGFDGAGFTAKDQLDMVSEFMIPGDIQMTGDGTPFVLLPECQTTGGYPRIGTVIPQDLPIVAQAPPGSPLRFRFIPADEARASWQSLTQINAELARTTRPLLRDPRTIPDLLSYQLISGVTAGRELDIEGEIYEN